MTALTSDNTTGPAHPPIVEDTPVGWLARSDPRERLRFAVVGATEQSATVAYSVAYVEWLAIEARPDPHGVDHHGA